MKDLRYLLLGLCLLFAVNVVAQEEKSAGTQAAAQTTVKTAKLGSVEGRSFFRQDNQFRYTYGNTFKDPFVYNGHGFHKNVLSFTHLDTGNRWGDNFLDVSMGLCPKDIPVSSSYYHANINTGAREVYVTYRHSFSFNNLFNTKTFSFGPIKDVFLGIGTELQAKNNDYAGEARKPMIGPGVSLKLPKGMKGYWNVYAMYEKEWNTEGTDITAWIAQSPGVWMPYKYGKPVVYRGSYTLQTQWGFPLPLGKAKRLTFDGFALLNGAKGRSAGGLDKPTRSAATALGQQFTVASAGSHITYSQTTDETLVKPRLMYNIGSHLGEKHNWQIGGGYTWWNNMFGSNHHHAPGAISRVPFVELDIHI